jgi:hypothetical protein
MTTEQATGEPDLLPHWIIESARQLPEASYGAALGFAAAGYTAGRESMARQVREMGREPIWPAAGDPPCADLLGETARRINVARSGIPTHTARAALEVAWMLGWRPTQETAGQERAPEAEAASHG